MSEPNQTSRLEAFCDGVFAIALTLLIIDIKIPPTEKINTTADFWLALKHIIPSIFAFILSFIIILITWVNHHNSLKLVNRSSSAFIYANGFMLLTVVFIPFPSSLMGEYILTDHAAPAVVLYNSTLALQAISWILVTSAALKDQLGKNEKSIADRSFQPEIWIFCICTLFSLRNNCFLVSFYHCHHHYHHLDLLVDMGYQAQA